MNRRLPTLLLLSALGAISGCDDSATPVSQDSAKAPQAPQPPAAGRPPAGEGAWEDSAAPVAGTRITIEPDPVSFCDAKRQAVEVSWDVTAAAPKHLQLWIESEPGKRKLWVETKTLAGTKRTGRWVAEGARFIALDAQGRHVLNTATVQAAPCG